MNRKREPKKSETLEVRLPHEVKDALMRKAQDEGRSASDVIRQFIDTYLADRLKEKRQMITLWKSAAAIGTAAVAAMWAIIAPSAVQAQPDLKAVFRALDANRNGTISLDEFARHRTNLSLQKIHEQMASVHRTMTALHGQGGATAHTPPSEEQLSGHFAKMDKDSDGKVTLGEFQAFHDHMMRAHKS